MKTLPIIITSLGIFSCAVFGANQPTDWQEETKRITLMGEALQKQTIEGFMDAIRAMAKETTGHFATMALFTGCVSNSTKPIRGYHEKANR